MKIFLRIRFQIFSTLFLIGILTTVPNLANAANLIFPPDCISLLSHEFENVEGAVSAAQLQSRGSAKSELQDSILTMIANELRAAVNQPAVHSNILEIEMTPDQFRALYNDPNQLLYFDTVQLVVDDNLENLKNAEALANSFAIPAVELHSEFKNKSDSNSFRLVSDVNYLNSSFIFTKYYKGSPEYSQDYAVRKIVLQRFFQEQRYQHERSDEVVGDATTLKVGDAISISYFNVYDKRYLRWPGPALSYVQGTYINYTGKPAIQTDDYRIIFLSKDVLEIRKMKSLSKVELLYPDQVVGLIYKNYGKTWGDGTERLREEGFSPMKPITVEFLNELKTAVKGDVNSDYAFSGLAVLFVNSMGRIDLWTYNKRELRGIINAGQKVFEEDGLRLPGYAELVPYKNLRKILRVAGGK